MTAAVAPPLAVVALANVEDHPAQRVTSEQALPLYAGVLTSLVGAGESGKTWLAAAAALDVVGHGDPVLILDGEMSAPTWRRRFLALGATQRDLGCLYYSELNDRSTDIAALGDTLRHLRVALVVWDSALAMLARSGVANENDNAAVSRVYGQLLRVVRGGPAGLIIDHTARNSGHLISRGATAKFDAVDLAFGVRLADGSIPGPTNPWAAVVSVEKDRHGLLGTRCDRAVNFDPHGGGRLALSMTQVETCTNRLAAGNPANVLAARIGELSPPPTSGNDAHKRLGGRRADVLAGYRLWAEQ